VESWLTELGWLVKETTETPCKGPEGNIQFLIAAGKPA
jgi:23S rRNA (cytidine1920-2'-O)/16S rRNA (cytidine1409-2'-O)-methyltransferase